MIKKKLLNFSLQEFRLLAEKWQGLESPELIKMYGFTLSSPHILVIESTKLGPLDAFLQKLPEHAVSIVGLIDVTYSLARALHYLQENKIVHGRIRCASLQVIRFEQPNLLLARLGDPGLQKTYSNNEYVHPSKLLIDRVVAKRPNYFIYSVPWIPFEYHNNLEKAKLDFKAEVWAYATTAWEIFSRGRSPTYKEVSSIQQTPTSNGHE